MEQLAKAIIYETHSHKLLHSSVCSWQWQTCIYDDNASSWRSTAQHSTIVYRVYVTVRTPCLTYRSHAEKMLHSLVMGFAGSM